MTTIPDDMVERVARAICNASSAEWRTGTFSVRSGKNFEWEEHPLDPYNNHWRSKTRAAIVAMQPAIMAERERCAMIAEMHDIRGDIAAAIRSQS
jgi:hypothetical protein